MNRCSFTFAAIIVLTVLSCGKPPPEPSIEGLWVGSHRGPFFRVPFNFLADFRSDGNVETLIQGVKEEESEWLISGDSLFIDTSSYLISEISHDLMVLRGKEGTSYLHRPRVADPDLHALPIPDLLEKKWWRMPDTEIAEGQEKALRREEFLMIDVDHFFLRRNYYYQDDFLFSETEKSCFELEDFRQNLYLNFSRRAMTCDSIYSEAAQILELSKERLKIVSGIGDNEKILELKSIPAKSRPSEDQLLNYCNDLFIGARGSAFSQYKGGIRAFRAYFMDRFGLLDANSSGYVSITFLLTCEGIPGRFTIHQSDLKGKATELPKELVEHCLQLLRSMPDWKKDHSEMQDLRMNFHLKIVEGQLVSLIR